MGGRVEACSGRPVYLQLRPAAEHKAAEEFKKIRERVEELKIHTFLIHSRSTQLHDSELMPLK